jgi:hypothetical protein
MPNRALFILTATIIFAGCATGVRSASLGPSELAVIETRTYNEDYNVVYDAAKKALQDAGYDIATSNRDAGAISTGYRSEKMSDLARATPFMSRTRASVNVTTSAEGTKVRAQWLWDISNSLEGWHDNSQNWTASDYGSRLSIFFDLVRQNVAAQPEH